MGNIGRAEIHHLLYAEIQQGAYLLTKTLVLILTKPMIRQRKRVEWMDIRLVPIINPCALVDQANCLMKSTQITVQGGKRVQGGEILVGFPTGSNKVGLHPANPPWPHCHHWLRLGFIQACRPKVRQATCRVSGDWVPDFHLFFVPNNLDKPLRQCLNDSPWRRRSPNRD